VASDRSLGRAAALTASYALIVVILMNGRVVLAHYAEFGTYSGVAEQLAIAAAGWSSTPPAPRSIRPWPHASRAWVNLRSGFVRCYSAERISSI
jgi:hypothetical protein